MKHLKRTNRSRAPRLRAAGARALVNAVVVTSLGTMAQAAGVPQFTSALDDSPLEIKLLPGEKITEGVQKFYDTGENPYKGDAQALAEGKELYETYCQACHLPDGSGRIGPSLIGDTHHYPRFTKGKGIFEIVYGGGAGAMQPFGKRLTQDQILHITAYVRSLKK
ncbi:MAG TPA: c-type cytochrome [Xanthobacteraceae bacterium]